MAVSSRLAETKVHTIGLKLREARESLGIGLEEAANVTRIGKNYLIAMEEETFDRLPSPAYVKGFLRVYAGFLGLSGDEIVALYEETSTQMQAPQLSETDEVTVPSRRKLSFPVPLIWSIPLLLLLALSGWLYYASDKGEEARSRPAYSKPKNDTVSPTLPARPATGPERDVAQVQAPPGDGQPMPVPAPAPASGIILKLKVNQDCWLNITIDDSVTQQYDLKAGDLIEWKGERVFTLDLGNAAGVEAELNGRALPPLGGQGKSAHVVLRGDGPGKF